MTGRKADSTVLNCKGGGGGGGGGGGEGHQLIGG